VDHGGAGDWSEMQGGRSLLARANERKGRYWHSPFSIRNQKNKKSLEGDMEGEQPGG